MERDDRGSSIDDMDNSTGMIRLNTTGTTFRKRERRGACSVRPSSEHCCSFLNDIGVTTKYCSLTKGPRTKGGVG